MSFRYALVLTALTLAVLATPVLAQSTGEVPPELEKRAIALEKEINTPCCWVPLDGHYSGQAPEMKALIRRKLMAGESDKQILADFEAQYGKRILTAPPARGFHVLLWVIPVLVLLVASVLVALLIRKWTRQSAMEPAPASASAKAANKQTGGEDFSDKDALDRVERELSSL